MQLVGKHIHFMGIGGIGVSALAEMAQAAGARVSGCDKADCGMTRRLAGKGIELLLGHDPRHVGDADLLVYSSAIPADHPERIAAGEKQEKRGRFLSRFMENRQAVGISGTHGKTTTSWLLGHILIHAGMDPQLFIGGVVPTLPEGNYRLGDGPFVAELDESDASFLEPSLTLAAITNIESDHLSHYRNDKALFNAFRQFAAGVEDSGLLVAGTDSPVSRELLLGHTGRKLSFGLEEPADVWAECLRHEDGMNRFRVVAGGADCGVFALPLPGRHNVQNALAALALAFELGVDVETARSALATACSVGRRLERLGTVQGAVLYSDYAHHPTEVAAAVAALKQCHCGPLLVVFQPHLYSRTRDYAAAFGKALAGADASLVVDVYPAREEPIPGVDSGLLVDAARKENGTVYGPTSLAAAVVEAERLAGDFEAVVFMGAGDIDAAARTLVAENGA